MFRNGFSFLKAFEVLTWVGLFALIPFTALGYFSEGSIPGQPLYSLKRGIENAVLTVDSLNANAKAFYQVALVNKRLAEVEKLLATSQAVSELNIDDISTTLANVQTTINGISDSIEKKQVEDKLIDSINQYKDKLEELKTIVENTPTVASANIGQTGSNQSQTQNHTQTTNGSGSNSNSNSNSSSQTSNTVQNSDIHRTFGVSPTTTFTPSPTSTQPFPQDVALTQDQKQQIIDNINQITQTLDQTVQNISGNPLPPPTLVPTFMPTPTFSLSKRHRDNNPEDTQQKHDGTTRGPH